MRFCAAQGCSSLVAVCEGDDNCGLEVPGPFSGCAPSLIVPVVAVAVKPRRVLAAETSRERSPRRVVDEFRTSSSSMNTGAAAVVAGEVVEGTLLLCFRAWLLVLISMACMPQF